MPADFTLVVGVSATESYELMRNEISAIVRTLNKNPPRITLGLSIDNGAISQLRQDIEQLAASAASAGGAVTVGAGGINRGDLESATLEMRDMKAAAGDVAAQIDKITAAEKAASAAAKDLQDAGAKASMAQKEGSKQSASAEKDNQALLRKSITLMSQMRNIQNNWTKAQNGKSAASYAANSEDIMTLSRYIDALRSGEMTAEDFKTKLDSLSTSYKTNSSEIKAAGENTKSFGDRLKSMASKLGEWFSVYRVMMLVYRTIKKMVSASIELDSAMTQLQIVTRKSNKDMRAFGDSLAETAKRIGASITDLANSATTYARLGYSLEDSEKLAEYTSKLKIVGNIDVSDAQDAVTAIIKAYDGIDIDNIQQVMDKLVTTGNNFPISVAQIAEGMNNASSTLSAAGNSFEESVALLTAANTTVQDAAKASTGLRTIAARIRNTKTDLDELGEDMTEAKYDELVQQLSHFHVALTNMNGEYRSTYDIMSDIAAKWNDMTSMEQAALATALSGTRQQAVFYSIIGQFQEAEGAMDAMANSAGALDSAYSTALESAQVRIEQFKATFQEFSANLISSNLIGVVVQIASALLSVFNALQKIYLLLPIITAAVIAIKAVSMAKNLTQVTAGLLAEKRVTDQLAASVMNLTARQKQQLKTNIENAIAAKTLTAEEGQQILETFGLAGSTNALTAANEGLAVSFKSVMASVPVWGWIALGISLVIELISWLTSSTEDSAKSISELNDELSQMAKDSSQKASEYSSLKKSVDDIVPRFKELAKGVNSLGENVSLTSKEYDEFWEINNKIAELFPQLDLGIDSNGNHILSLSYSVDTLSESFENLLEIERQLAMQKSADYVGAALDNITSGNYALEKKYKNIISNLEDEEDINGVVESYMYAVEALRNGLINTTSLFPNAGANGTYNREQVLSESGIGSMDDLVDDIVTSILLNNGEDISNSRQITQEIIDKHSKDNVTNWDAVLKDEYIQSGVEKFSGYIRALDDIQEQRKARWKSIGQFLNAYIKTGAVYNSIEEEAQPIVDRLISNLDYSYIEMAILSKNGTKSVSEEDLKKYVDNIIEQLAKAKPEVQTAMAGLFDIKSAYESGLMTVKDFRNSVTGIYQGIDADLPKELRDNIHDLISGDFKGKFYELRDGINAAQESAVGFIDGLSHKDFEIAYKIISEEGSMSIEELSAAIEKFKFDNAAMINPLDVTDLAGELDSVASSVDKVTSAMEKLANGTELTKKELLELISQYPELLKQSNIFAYGSVEGQRSALQAILDMKEQEYDAEIDIKIKELEATKTVLQNQLELEKKKADVLNEIEVGVANGSIETKEQLLDKIDELNNLQGQNYVEFKDGELKVNEEALSAELQEGVDFGTSAAENIWTPYARVISDAHVKGYQGSLSATDSFTSRYVNKVSGWLSGVAGRVGGAVKAMFAGEPEKAKELLFGLSGSGGDNTIDTSGKDLVVSFGDGALTTDDIRRETIAMRSGGEKNYFPTEDFGTVSINGVPLKSWINQQNENRIARIEQVKKALGDIDIAINNLEDLKNLKLKDIYASRSSSSGSSGSSKSDTSNAFKTLYDYHKHLIEMEEETTGEFLAWLNDAYKDAYKDGEITLDEYYKYEEEVFKGLRNLEKEAKSSVDALVDYRVKMLKQDLNNEKDALKERLDALKNFYDKQKEMLQDSYDEEKYLEEQAEKRKAVADIQEKLAMLSYDDSAWAQMRRRELQEELSEKQKELNDFERDHAKEVVEDDLDRMYKLQEKRIDMMLENIEKKENDPRYLYNKALKDIQNGSTSLYEEMIAWNNQYGDGIKETITSAWESAYEALQNYKNLSGELYGGIDIDNAPVYVLVKKAVGTTSTPARGYASGTRHASPGLHAIDEAGTETIFQSADGVRYRMFSGGEKVLNAKASNFLYDFATSGGTVLENFIRSVFSGSTNKITQPVTNNEITMGDIVIQGNADRATVSEIRRAQRAAVENMLKEFNKLNR